MKTGKLSESILKRSVLGQIKFRRKEVIKGAGAGEDCAFFALNRYSCAERNTTGRENLTAVSTETVALPVKNAAYLAVMAAANNLRASGARPIGVMLSLTLPPEGEERQLKELMGEAERCCEEWNVQIAGGHTEISPAVKSPIVTVTAIGEMLVAAKARDCRAQEAARAAIREHGLSDTMQGKIRSMDIVMSKWIGMEGTFVLATEKRKELLKRYPASLILAAEEQGSCLSVAKEAAAALEAGAYAMHDVRNGGIFGALWELGHRLNTGFCVDLKKIPIRQETIEVCEFFNLNPYELLSGGALLMAAEDGGALVKALEEAGVFSAVIGSTCSGNDRIIKNGEEVRYLGFPSPDEIFKVLF